MANIRDNFESYSLGTLGGSGGWSTNSDYTVQNTTVNPDQGTKAITKADVAGASVIIKTFDKEGKGTLGIYVRQDDLTGATAASFQFRESGDTRFSVVLDVGTTSIIAVGVGVDTLETGKWFEVQIQFNDNTKQARTRSRNATDAESFGAFSAWQNLAGDFGGIDDLRINAPGDSNEFFFDDVTFINEINLSETVTVLEAINPVDINVSELVTVIDIPGHYPDLVIVTDTPIVFTVDSINTSDSITVNENVAIETQLGGVDINDIVAVNEDVEINNQVGPINVEENVTVAEDIVISILSALETSDNVSIAEDVTINNNAGDISIIDTVTANEFVDPETIPTTEKAEIVTVTEDIQITNSIGDINTSDTINAPEDTQVTATLGDISVDDSITVLEGLDPEHVLSPFASDNVTVTDVLVNVTNSLGGINIFDTATVNEFIDPEQILEDTEGEDITVTENITVSSDFNPENSDTIIVTEDVSLFVGASFSVVDSITVNESISSDNQPAGVVIDDTVTIVEDVLAIDRLINVSDSVTIAEGEGPSTTSFINVSDSITLKTRVIRVKPDTVWIDRTDISKTWKPIPRNRLATYEKEL